MEADNRSLLELPKANLEDVLARLPVKSLLTCSCASKTLLNIIAKDSDFAKLHCAKSEPQLLIQCPWNTKFYLIDLDADTTGGHRVQIEVKPRFNLPGNDFSIVHSCNGLALLNDFDAEEVHLFIVCNPVTGEYIMLPKTSFYSRNSTCAFFFCPKTNRFKVLRLFHRVAYSGLSSDSDMVVDSDPNLDMEVNASSDSGSDSHLHSNSDTTTDLSSNHDRNPDLDTYLEESDLSFDSDSDSAYSESDAMGEIFVSGSGSWEPFSNLPFSPVSIYSSCHLDKVTHWLCFDEKVQNLIVFFHFETHQFGEIAAPFHMGEAHASATNYMSLIVIGECLSIFDSLTTKGTFDIWVMKEYGVTTSWAKDFVIDTTTWGIGMLSVFHKPVICRRNGELVMIRDGCNFLFYDLSKKTGRIVMLQPYEHPYYNVVHTPSVVSLRDVMTGSNTAVLNVPSRFAPPESNRRKYLELLTTFSG